MQIKISDQTIQRIEEVTGETIRHGGDYLLNKIVDMIEGKPVLKQRKWWNTKEKKDESTS